MAAPSVQDLLVQADNLKLSLLERQRTLLLNLPAKRQDDEITSSLASLSRGLEQLETSGKELPAAQADDVVTLRNQYNDLFTQFHGTAPPPPTAPQQLGSEASLPSANSAATQSRSQRQSVHVRFRDNPDAVADEYTDSPEEAANRAALFADQERYRDEPGPPDQSDMDNQQIHAYHTQTLREQDEQLDSLSQSIGRQRVLGIQMGNEMDEQNALLDDVERGVDRHTSTLGRARRNLGNVARKSKDNWSWLTIGILIVILVLLIAVLK